MPAARVPEGSTACSNVRDRAYARTLLGKLDRRWLNAIHFRRALAVLVGVLMVVSSVQFVVKIQQTEFSEFRGRSKHRTAVGRWLPDVVALQEGQNPYGPGHWFPNPPLVLIALVPLAHLPILATAIVWSTLKIVALVAGAWLVISSFRRDGSVIPLGVLIMTLAFSARPLMGDITHGNINIFVFFEIALAWYLYVCRRDLSAGIVVGLATVTKVTPALLLVYFVYKREWRVVVGAGVGLVVFAVVIPSLLVGFERNNTLLKDWHAQMVAPYVQHGYVTVEEINQSLPSMFMKWFAFPHLVRGTWIDVWQEAVADHAVDGSWESARLESLVKLKEKLQKSEALVSWADGIDQAFPVELGGPALARESGQLFVARLRRPGQRWMIRGAGLLLVLLLAWVCRSPSTDRGHPTLLLELSLVLLAMLLLSERTWKHHMVTLPIVYLATWYTLTCHDWSDRFRRVFVAGLVVQFFLLVIVKSDPAMYVGVMTVGLLLCFVQNAILLRRLPFPALLPTSRITPPVPPRA